ncbi:MAG: ATP-binding protein [Aggregatilineales bacterium]
MGELEAVLNDVRSSSAEHLSRSAAQRLAKAVTLYRGDFLTGFYLSDSPAFEDWALLERERLQRRVIDGLDQLVATSLEQGTYAEGMAHATRLLQLDPLREAAHRQMMTLLTYTGQRRAALAQYETCRAVLAQELGVTPDEETGALFRKIQAGELERTSHEIGDNLPVQPTPFVGRSAELTQIAQQLGDPTCRLLTLVGPGGIGKTRLAIQAASLKRDDFAHGVCFVPLAALNSPDLLSGAIIDALKLNLRGREAPLTQLLSALRPKELLFVLDNFEHLLDGAALLSNILASVPHVKLLITSRERLNLREEWLFEVQGMDFPNKSVKEGADQYSAVQLFAPSARRIQVNFSLAKDLTVVLHICQRVEGSASVADRKPADLLRTREKKRQPCTVHIGRGRYRPGPI